MRGVNVSHATMSIAPQKGLSRYLRSHVEEQGCVCRISSLVLMSDHVVMAAGMNSIHATRFWMGGKGRDKSKLLLFGKET